MTIPDLILMGIACAFTGAVIWWWGYITGHSLGRRASDLGWDVRVRALHRKWERDAGIGGEEH